MPLHSCTDRIQWITSDGLNAHELVPSKRSSKIAPRPPGPRSPPLATELPSIPGQSLLQLHRPLKCHYCAPTQPTKAVRLSEASKARTHTDWSDNLCDSPPAPFPPSLFPINLLIPPFPPTRTHTHVCEQVALSFSPSLASAVHKASICLRCWHPQPFVQSAGVYESSYGCPRPTSHHTSPRDRNCWQRPSVGMRDAYREQKWGACPKMNVWGSRATFRKSCPRRITTC